MGQISERLGETFRRHADLTAIELPAAGELMSFSDVERAATAWAAHFADPDRPLMLHMAKTPAFYQLETAAFLHQRRFCPIDLLNPVARVASIAAQLDDVLVVTDQPDRAALLRESGVAVELIPGTPPVPRGAPAQGTEGHVYISTSGTTGTPKLVDVAHDAMVKFVDWSVPFYEVGPGARWSAFSNIEFDLSLVDLLTSLLGGATLVGFTTMGETARLSRYIADYEITHWHSVPSVIGYIARGARSLGHVRVFSFCGEPLLRSHCLDLRSVAPTSRIINTYGPTEGPLFCTAHEVTDTDLADDTLTSMPIGRAIPGWRLDLAHDDQGDRIIIMAERLAEGYFGHDDPAFGRALVNGVELQTFDTGDYVRHHGEHLVFSHRRDRMVKIAGIRLDLGDVAEACLQVGLDDAVVALHNGGLVVWYSAVEGVAAELDSDGQLRWAHRLRELLPDYAVPGRFEFTAAFPRTASGKVDRAELSRRLAEADGEPE